MVAGVNDKSCSRGPVKLAAGIEGPGGGKAEGPLMDTDWNV